MYGAPDLCASGHESVLLLALKDCCCPGTYLPDVVERVCCLLRCFWMFFLLFLNVKENYDAFGMFETKIDLGFYLCLVLVVNECLSHLFI